MDTFYNLRKLKFIKYNEFKKNGYFNFFDVDFTV